MAVLANMARMTTATTGTGTLTLGSAVSGFLSFAAAGITDGQTVSYAIEDGNQREVGRGVYTTSGATLSRTVLKSTNSDAAISLSGAAEVFITALAEDFPSAATDSTPGLVEKATAAEVRAATDDKFVSADLIEDACAPQTITYGSTTSIDWAAFVSGQLTCPGSPTLANPTNVQPGTTRVIRIVGNNGTERSLSFGSNYAGPLPEETVTDTAGLLLTLYAASTTEIHVMWKAFEL